MPDYGYGVPQRLKFLRQKIFYGQATPDEIQEYKNLGGTQDILSNVAKGVGEATKNDILPSSSGQAVNIFSSAPGTIAVGAQNELKDALLRGASPQDIFSIVQKRGIQKEQLQKAIDDERRALGQLPEGGSAPGIFKINFNAYLDKLQNQLGKEVLPEVPGLPTEVSTKDAAGFTQPIPTVFSTPALPGAEPIVTSPNKVFAASPETTSENPKINTYGGMISKLNSGQALNKDEQDLFDQIAAKEQADLEAARKRYLDEEEAGAAGLQQKYLDIFQPSFNLQLQRARDVLGSHGLGTGGFEGSGALQELGRKAAQESAQQASLAALDSLMRAREQHAQLGLQAAEVPSIFRRSALERKLGKSDIFGQQQHELDLANLGYSQLNNAANIQRRAARNRGLGALLGGLGGGLFDGWPGAYVGSQAGNLAGSIFF